MEKTSVLFICVHNSARSQMAESFLNHLGGERYTAESAGLEPGKLNPLAIEVMREIGIDISQNPVKDVFDIWRAGKLFRFVITVCDAKNAESCPVFPGIAERLAWWFDDPSSFTGTHEEKLVKTRLVRDEIKNKLKTSSVNSDHKCNSEC
ncbi:MAG: arsenate reductase ArsC [Bacteroidetes bacterium]|nr:arsenate reductase ArsC [Bacteroidota bacterium]